MEFFLEPPIHEWFYDEKRDVVVASTTITSHVYVYLDHFYGAATSGALTIPIPHATPSTSLMHPQPSPMLPRFDPMLVGLPLPEPMPLEVPVVDLSFADAPASLSSSPPLPDYHLQSSRTHGRRHPQLSVTWRAFGENNGGDRV